jgi:hypothetical protein
MTSPTKNMLWMYIMEMRTPLFPRCDEGSAIICHISLNSLSLFKFQTGAIVSLNCSHVLFSLLTTNVECVIQAFVWLHMVLVQSSAV